MRMVNLQRKLIYFFALLITCTIAAVIVHKSPSLSINNRFVSYAIIINIAIFVSLLLIDLKSKVLRYTLLTAVGMSGFAFALVPLYDVFCEATGLNGKIDLTKTAATSQGIDLSRTIIVEFVVSHNREMPWDFKPKHQELTVHPGELVATAYFAKNRSARTMLGQAIPSITPSRVSRYFKKIECFCFSNQKLGPGETAYLGLRFYLDPAIPKDVHRLTLAYTIFDVTDTADTNREQE